MEWGRDQPFLEFQSALSDFEEQAARMYSLGDRKVFLCLLAEAKSRIFADYQRADGRLKAFFLILMRRLIDPQLTIGSAMRAARINHNNCSPAFQRVAGIRPRDYVEYHRLRLGQGMMRYTDAKIYTVANTLGYSEHSLFSRVYSKKLGYPPKKEPKADPAEIRALLEGMPSDLLNPTVSPDPRTSPNTTEETLGRSAAADMGGFWAEASGRNGAELKRYMFQHAKVISVKHFYFLIEKAKYEGRVDRKRGVELAHAAVDALNIVEYWTGEVHTDERAFGYAVVGNHHRLAFEPEESVKWFQEAMRLLPADQDENPLLFAQVNHLRIRLLWCQGRLAEAIKLSNAVIPIIREHGSAELLARALQLKGEIYLSSGYLSRALSLFSAAIGLSRAIDDPYVVFSAHFNLTYLYTRMSKPVEATARFEEVKRLTPTVQLSPSHLACLEGAVHSVNEQYDKAEAAYLEAREGFMSQGLDLFAALSSLELALVYLEQGKLQEAFSTAISTIPSISRYSCRSEAISALAILQEASKTQDIEKAAIRKVLHHLEKIRRDPAAPLSARCQK